MKTLSDDITIKLPTTGMAEGYVVTTIYANGIGVFTGRSYIQGVDSSLYVNVNDIAVQNRGKDDYLKLNNDGLVETVPLVNNTSDTYSYQRRWNRGQVGNYKVRISDNNNAYEDSEYVLTGYDYQNRDLKPTSMDEEDSSLCRIMQGCDWIYNHEDEIGSFLNLLLPHYPLVKTDKYGFGLQICAGKTPLSSLQYSLRRDMGEDVELGYPIYGLSNTTFLTLNDLINGITGSKDNDSDVSVYLKQSNKSGDEFGDFVEGYTYYPGEVKLSRFIQTQYSGSGFPRTRIITRRSPAEFKAAVETYKTQGRIQLEIPQEFYNLDLWDAEKITNDSNALIYYYASRISEEDAQNVLNEYESYYTEVTTSTIPVLDIRIALTPVFSSSTSTVEIPTMYYGTCPVAILDRCYSRYYLAWNDRYGDIQSQAFDGKIEYTEDFERNEIKDYKMRRRVIHNELQPKWKLNTKWLNEDIYPMYESIFTSPYLLLYDTQTDRSWNVILTDTNYKEKTFKTEKTLFNLEINVEANTKENRIF